SSMAVLGLHDMRTARITGSIKVGGQEVVGLGESKLRKLRGKEVAMIFQDALAALHPFYKVGSQLAEAYLVHHPKASKREARRKAIEMLDRVGIPQPDRRVDDFPHQFSGGMRQRAMIAMGLINDPKLLIADEPTTALDVTTQIEVLAAIRKIVEDFDTAAIYITHDLAVVAQMADRIKVLLKGDEVEEATTREMLDHPQEDYTKSLWAVREFQHAEKPLAPKGAVPVISVRNVTAGYGKIDVLQDVSFDIHEARTVAVVGESGSGKSTTARCITGLLPPRQGQILLDGEALPPDYRKRSKMQLRQVQMIYQMADTAMNPRQTVGTIIGRPLEFYFGLRGAEKKRRIMELLEEIEMADGFIDRYPAELSGGQKQRVAIARSLISKPKIIFADEPTGALDSSTSYEVMDILKEINAEGITMILVTHEHDIAAMTRKIIKLKDGRIDKVIKNGDLQNWKERYSKELATA
ncbi:MAG: ABC transporter ATP-binding protein, partial [Alcanivorax sp.]|nr:ABC transporter ATP-binding protein [Alcanivorax sp.]